MGLHLWIYLLKWTLSEHKVLYIYIIKNVNNKYNNNVSKMNSCLQHDYYEARILKYHVNNIHSWDFSFIFVL